MLRSSKVLEYYKSEAGEVQKGVINLEDCKTVHSDLSHKKYKNVFDIETKERIYYLVAQSQEEMKEWVDVLCRVCGLIVQGKSNQCTGGCGLYWWVWCFPIRTALVGVTSLLSPYRCCGVPSHCRPCTPCVWASCSGWDIRCWTTDIPSYLRHTSL